jgi:hypothetical protein
MGGGGQMVMEVPLALADTPVVGHHANVSPRGLLSQLVAEDTDLDDSGSE